VRCVRRFVGFWRRKCCRAKRPREGQ
jgi:hypothetical protein